MKCKLLVAEDELIERKVLCRTLQKYLGDLISLYEAKNGREALEIFAREVPQVAVLDIEMPGLTGLEVARKIRETDKNCVILFLTGFDKFILQAQARVQNQLARPVHPVFVQVGRKVHLKALLEQLAEVSVRVAQRSGGILHGNILPIVSVDEAADLGTDDGGAHILVLFPRQKNTKIVLGYNKDKIVLRFTK